MASTTKEFNDYRSQQILEFLSDHPLISRNGLCDIVGYDVSNLNKAFNGDRSIPGKHLLLFEQTLKEYGFKVEGAELE